MKFQYLGTAAAEGLPGMFCSCEICNRSRQAGGKNIRTRSQAVIDDRLLIDFPADTYLHSLNYGLDLTAISDCIVTHNHSDHFYPSDLMMRTEGFAHDLPCETLTVYGTAPAMRDARCTLEHSDCEASSRIAFQEIFPFQSFEAAGYLITPYQADHDSRCNPVFYSVSDRKKTLLYANDTGYFPEETWSCLARSRPHFDLVSLDCTGMLMPWNENHMGLDANEEVRKRLFELGCADESTIFIVHHFSHNGGFTYDDFKPIAGQKGFEVSFDGMVIEL